MNDAIHDLALEASTVNPNFFGMKSAFLTYAPNVQEYVIALDVLTIELVEVLDIGGPPYPTLARTDFWLKDAPIGIGPTATYFGGGTGEPQAYYVYGTEPASTANTLGFIPIPPRAGTVIAPFTGNVRYWYHAIRTFVGAIDTSAANTPDLPLDWHPVIAHRMAVLAAMADRGDPSSYAQTYDAMLGRLLLRAGVGRGEPYEQIQIMDDDY